MLAVALVAGIYLWFHESVAAIQAHSEDVKAAQKFLGEPPPPGHAAIALVIGYDHRAGEARERSVALGHGDAAARRPGHEDDLDALVPARPDRARSTARASRSSSAKINAAYANCGSKGTLQTVARPDRPADQLPDHGQLPRLQADRQQARRRLDRRRPPLLQQQRRPRADVRLREDQPPARATSCSPAAARSTTCATGTPTPTSIRVARQQQFVKAMKYQLAHNFSIAKVPKIVGALTKNVEVGVGGGRKVSGKTILSYAFFAYHLPSGHFFQTQIQGLTGYSDLRTDSSNIQAAVQDWLKPDVEAARVATAVALGRKVRTTDADARADVDHGPERERGRGRGRQRRLPALAARLPDRAAAGRTRRATRPRTTTSTSKVYWNPRVKRSAAAAKSVAKLFAPADAEAMPPEVRSLGNGTRCSPSSSAQTFHGTITPAPPVKRADAARAGARDLEPVRLADDAEEAQPKVPGFKLEVADRDRELVGARPGEAVLRLPDPRGRQGRPARLPHRRRSVLGDRADDWDEAPVLGGQELHGTSSRAAPYDFYYNGPQAPHDRPARARRHLLGRQLAARQHLERDDDRDRQGAADPSRRRSSLRTRMARIAFFGAGYAGLVSGACFADLGHTVVIRDVVPERIDGAARRRACRSTSRASTELIERNADRPVLHALDGGGGRGQRVPVRLRRHAADRVGRRRTSPRSGRWSRSCRRISGRSCS